MLQRLPVEHDFIVHSGATFRVTMRWSPEGVPEDFTGWDAWMPIGTATDEEPLRELTVANGGITLYDDGYIMLYMSEEDTAEVALLDMRVEGEVGQLRFNLFLRKPVNSDSTPGDVIAFMRGNFFVQHTVPRPKLLEP